MIATETGALVASGLRPGRPRRKGTLDHLKPGSWHCGHARGVYAV